MPSFIFIHEFFIPSLECPKWGFYCNGNRIELDGTIQSDWKACARSCKTNFNCKFWHYWQEKTKCFLYTDCKFDFDNYRRIQNVAGNKDCTRVTGTPGTVSFDVN